MRAYLKQIEPLIQAARHRNNLGVGRYADHAAQNLRRHTVTGVTLNDIIEPGATSQMHGDVGTKRVLKDVDIGKGHGLERLSRRSFSG